MVYLQMSNPERIDLIGTNFTRGNYSIVQPDGSNYLLVNGAEMTPTLFGPDGQQVSEQILSDAIGSRAFGVEVVDLTMQDILCLIMLVEKVVT